MCLGTAMEMISIKNPSQLWTWGMKPPCRTCISGSLRWGKLQKYPSALGPGVQRCVGGHKDDDRHLRPRSAKG